MFSTDPEIGIKLQNTKSSGEKTHKVLELVSESGENSNSLASNYSNSQNHSTKSYTGESAIEYLHKKANTDVVIDVPSNKGIKKQKSIVVNTDPVDLLDPNGSRKSLLIKKDEINKLEKTEPKS